MGGMPYGLAGPTRQITLGHEPASEIGADGGNAGAAPVGDVVVFGGAWIGLGAMLPNDMTTFATQGYFTEIYSTQLTEQAGRFTKPTSHRFPTTEVHDAFQLALSPGAAKKAIVTFGD